MYIQLSSEEKSWLLTVYSCNYDVNPNWKISKLWAS